MKFWHLSKSVLAYKFLAVLPFRDLKSLEKQHVCIDKTQKSYVFWLQIAIPIKLGCHLDKKQPEMQKSHPKPSKFKLLVLRTVYFSFTVPRWSVSHQAWKRGCNVLIPISKSCKYFKFYHSPWDVPTAVIAFRRRAHEHYQWKSVIHY